MRWEGSTGVCPRKLSLQVTIGACNLSKELDMDMMYDLHGDQYEWYQLFTQPRDVGHAGLARHRTYCIGAHTERTACLHDPRELLERVSARMHEAVQTRISDYLLASDYEVLLEAQQVAIRRKVSFRPKSLDLHYLLTQRERAALKVYKAMYKERFGATAESDPDFCCFLGDSPPAYCTWSAASGAIPTYRVGSRTALYWIPARARFLTSRERLLSMGWPVHEVAAEAMGVCQVPARDVQRAADLAGNGMHFGNVAVMQLISLSCFGPADSEASAVQKRLRN